MKENKQEVPVLWFEQIQEVAQFDPVQQIRAWAWQPKIQRNLRERQHPINVSDKTEADCNKTGHPKSSDSWPHQMSVN